MKTKLMIVTNLGRLKAFRVDWTLQKTARLELLDQMELEEAHHRVLDTVSAPPLLTWGGLFRY
jgi:hypothetical protein